MTKPDERAGDDKAIPKMTKDEFQKRYHSYQTHSEEEAKAEAGRVNIEGDEAIPVNFSELGWCLMLKSTWNYISQRDTALPAERPRNHRNRLFRR